MANDLGSIALPHARERIGNKLWDLAEWVHERLSVAQHLRLGLGEETITEMLLLYLAESFPLQVTCLAHSKPRETKTGADWEWWFSDGVGKPAFGMRVQAKKLKELRTGVYGYDFAYTPKSGSPRQVDRLIHGAHDANLPAVYALYNGPDLELRSFQWTCGLAPDKGLLGVSLLAAQAARRLASSGGTPITSVGHLCRPWSCLMLCPTSLQLEQARREWPEEVRHRQPERGAPLSVWAADLVTDLYVRGAQELEEPSSRLVIKGAASGFRSYDELPEHVRAMMEHPTDLSESYAPDELGGVAVITASGGRKGGQSGRLTNRESSGPRSLRSVELASDCGP